MKLSLLVLSIVLLTCHATHVHKAKPLPGHRRFHPRWQSQGLKNTILSKEKLQVDPSKRSNSIRATNVNAIVDNILNNVVQKLNTSGDPLALPDFEDGFSETGPAGVVWQGKIGIEQGSLSGLSTLHRNGNASLEGSLLTGGNISMTATINNLDLKYRFVAEFENLGPQGTIDAVIKETNVDVALSLKLVGMKIQLLSLNLRLGHITVNINGLGPVLTFLSETLDTWIVNLLRGPISNFVEDALVEKINQALENIDVNCLINGCAATTTAY